MKLHIFGKNQSQVKQVKKMENLRLYWVIEIKPHNMHDWYFSRELICANRDKARYWARAWKRITGEQTKVSHLYFEDDDVSKSLLYKINQKNIKELDKIFSNSVE